MKPLLFILFWIPVAESFAQADSTKPVGLYRTPDGKTGKDSTGPYFRMLTGQDKNKAWLDSGRISHRTQRGRIYKMPVDNMPCLVPDSGKVEKFWGVKPPPDNRMPNAFDRRKQARPKSSE